MGSRSLQTRRAFLRNGLRLAAAGGAFSALPRTALPKGGKAALPDRILVLVQLAGGNDGLNTVIPIHDDAYYRSRPRLAIRRRHALRLTDEFALHPAAVGLKRLYDDGRLAIVHGVGTPEPQASHFRSSHIWETASPEGRMGTGWIGRCLERRWGLTDRPSCRAVTLTADSPTALQGKRFRPTVLGSPTGEARFPTFGESLAQAATRIHQGFPAQVYHVSLNGFDTHSSQAPRHAYLLAELGDGLHDFVARLASEGKLDRVLIATYSEFGRSVAENAAGGTDHGEAAPMLLIGSGVRAGLHGCPPRLAACQDGRVRATVDYRRVYAAILRSWLGADDEAVLGGDFMPIDLLRG
jgi:uncharacterized protein (DUF1501 family)